MSTSKNRQPDRSRGFRISPEDLLLVVLAAAAGVGAGWLLTQAGVPVGQAVLGGFAAFGASFVFLDRVLDRPSGR